MKSNKTDKLDFQRGACYACGNPTTGVGKLAYEDKSRKAADIFLCSTCEKRAGGKVLLMVRQYKIAWQE
jgi:hypothetical protein